MGEIMISAKELNQLNDNEDLVAVETAFFAELEKEFIMLRKCKGDGVHIPKPLYPNLDTMDNSKFMQDITQTLYSLGYKITRDNDYITLEEKQILTCVPDSLIRFIDESRQVIKIMIEW